METRFKRYLLLYHVKLLLNPKANLIENDKFNHLINILTVTRNSCCIFCLFFFFGGGGERERSMSFSLAISYYYMKQLLLHCFVVCIYLLSEASSKAFATKNINMPLKMMHIYDLIHSPG